MTPFDLRIIEVAASALAAGWTTPEILRAAEPGMLDAIERLAAVKRAHADKLAPEPPDATDAALDVKIASHLLAQRLTTPEHLAVSMFAAYAADARDVMIKTAEKLARGTRAWGVLHPGEDHAPKSKAEADADMLGKPRPADPRAAGADAPPAKPETVLERAGRDDPEAAALITRARDIAAKPYSYETALEMTTTLKLIAARPGGGQLVEELQRAERVAVANANAAHDAQRHAEMTRNMRGSTDDLHNET